MPAPNNDHEHHARGSPPLAECLFLLLEDPSHFARYLSRLAPDSRAGEPRDERWCPLARFLNTMAYPHDSPGAPLAVGSERIRLLTGHGQDIPVSRLPYWAQELVSAFDEPGPRRITPPLVLELLHEVMLQALLF